MSAKYKWIYQKEYANFNKLALEHIKQKWEKLDKRLFKTRDKSKYKIIDYKTRKRKIKYGIVFYKRRIHEYYSIELQK